MVKIVMAGAAGRMGRAILKLAHEDKEIKIIGGLESKGSPFLNSDIGELIGVPSVGAKVVSDAGSVLSKADVLIDFTHASAVSGNLKAVQKTKTGYVLGTTNLNAGHLKSLKTASKKIGIVQAPNMSIGVNLLFGLTEIAAHILSEDYDAEISEIHHRHKKDSPSGTAAKLLEIIARERKKSIEKDVVFGRKGDIGARPRGEIGVMALRGGDVVGDHTVHFFGEGERLELTHKASSRDAFAKGALVAAKFLKKHKRGLFDMRQVLGMG